MEDDEKKDIYYDDGVPLDIKRQIIVHCSPSTVDLLRSVSRSWFKAINKSSFIIRNSRLNYFYFYPLRQYSTSLSIEIVHPPVDLEPIFRSIAEQLSTHVISLKLGKQRDSIPDWNYFNHLKALTNLTELDLSLGQIDLAFISHLPSLKRLHLRRIMGALTLHDPLSSTVLEDLALDSCLAGSDLLASITNPSRLTKLELNSRYPVHQIKQFTNIKNLHIIDNKDYTNNTRVDISAFPFLESLQIETSKFSCNLLDLTKLTKLVINEELDAGLKLPLIGHLTNLKVLTLYYGVDYYEDPSLEFFSKLTKLEELNLSNIFENEDLAYIEHLNCPNLTKLLAYINIDEGDNIQHLTKLAPSLLSLELQLWTDTKYVTAINSLTNLTHLKATFSDSDEDFLKCQLSTKLKKLTLKTGDDSNVNFNLKLPNLEKLSFCGIKFSDEDAQYLSSTLQQLSFTSPTQPVIASFAHLTKVTCLKVNKMFPEEFANIVQLVNLKKLISHTLLTPHQLSQLTSLQYYVHKEEY